MSRKPSFANLRSAGLSGASKKPQAAIVPASPAVAEGQVVARPASREGRKQIAGFFSPEMSLSMHMLARRQGRSLQSLMAEAFNDVLRKHGESPIGD